jgi:SAM-dependent methyltransferase
MAATPTPNRKPYAEDLAYIHDRGYDFHARGLAAGLLNLLDAADLTNKTVVDLGCGSGIWAAALDQAGYRPVGVDISPAMIALARLRVPGGEFHVASFLDVELPACRAITALGEVVCYLFDSRTNRRALGRFVKQAYEALVPGGLLVFDMIEIGTDRGRQPACREGDDWACLVSFEYVARKDQLLRHITTFRQVGGHYRRDSETHRVQLYDQRDIAALLRRAGFRVRTFRSLGEYQLLPGRIGFLARKPHR